MEEEEEDEEVGKQEEEENSNKKKKKKKAGLQSQKRNDYTSSCLLVTFLKVNYSSCFSPPVTLWAALENLKKKGEMHSAISACRHDANFLLFFLTPGPSLLTSTLLSCSSFCQALSNPEQRDRGRI